MRRLFAIYVLLSLPMIASGADRPTVLAHYMPWFVYEPATASKKPVHGWHWTMGHFDPTRTTNGQPQIASKHHPKIGLYDSGDVNVIEYHLLTMKMAGIDGVIVDWYGQVDVHDYYAIHRNTTRILKVCERLKLKFAICYEDKTLGALVKAKKIKQADRTRHAASEIKWLGKYWFKSGSYVQFDRKPLLLSFGESGLNDKEWTDCIKQIQFPIAWFSEHRRRPSALGAYDWPEPKLGLKMQTRFAKDAKQWPAAMPVVYPRFDDMYLEAGVSKGYPVIADNKGKTFKETLDRALRMNPKIIQIATWNDWGEGTDIEPSVELGYRDLEVLRRKFRSHGKYDHLLLPAKLLNKRRVAESDQKKLDKIAILIASEKVSEAQKELAALDGK